MANRLIIGRNYAEQRKGYPVNINVDVIRNGTVLKTASAVAPGEVLIRTATSGIYEGAENATLAGKIAADVIGLALATNVKTKLTYGSAPSTTDWEPGDKMDYISEGEISIEFAPITVAIKEGDPVYLVIAIAGTPTAADLGKLTNLTTLAADAILLPGFVWVGETEGTLSIVRKAY